MLTKNSIKNLARHARLRRFLNENPDIGKRGKTHLQKFIQIWTQKGNKNFDYELRMREFGPLAPLLQADLDFEDQEGYIAINKTEFRHELIPNPDKIKEFQEELKEKGIDISYDDSHLDEVKKLFDEDFQEYRDPETFTTMNYVINVEKIRFQGEVYQRVRRYKVQVGRFSKDTVMKRLSQEYLNKIWGFLIKAGLIPAPVLRLNRLISELNEVRTLLVLPQEAFQNRKIPLIELPHHARPLQSGSVHPNVQAYEQLLNLVTDLRNLIHKRIFAIHPKEVANIIPPAILEKWKDLREREQENGLLNGMKDELVEFSYLDDIIMIFNKGKNKNLFRDLISEQHLKIVTAKLSEIVPIRNRICHFRQIDPDEVELLATYSEQIKYYLTRR